MSVGHVGQNVFFKSHVGQNVNIYHVIELTKKNSSKYSAGTCPLCGLHRSVPDRSGGLKFAFRGG